jgi:hypothetical protein
VLLYWQMTGSEPHRWASRKRGPRSVSGHSERAALACSGTASGSRCYSKMPRYFFHTEDGECLHDEDGTELPDQMTARNEALFRLANWVKRDPAKFSEDWALSVTVADDRGLILYIIDLSAVASPSVSQHQAAASS